MEEHKERCKREVKWSKLSVHIIQYSNRITILAAKLSLLQPARPVLVTIRRSQSASLFRSRGLNQRVESLLSYTIKMLSVLSLCSDSRIWDKAVVVCYLYQPLACKNETKKIKSWPIFTSGSCSPDIPVEVKFLIFF